VTVLTDNEELQNLYYSPSVIRMIHLRRTRLAGHVARIGEREEEEEKKEKKKNTCTYWWNSHKQRDHYEDQDMVH
jgi:hypothetical protein